jgi:hypothetical protein
VTREPDPTGFDAIVASWRAEGNVPEWPDDLRLDDDRTDVEADALGGSPTDAGTEADAGDRPDEPGPAGAEGPPVARHADRRAADRPDTDSPGSAPRDPDAAPDPAVEHRDTDPGGAAPRRSADPAPEDHADRRDPTSRERGHLARPAADPLAEEHFVPPEPPPLPRMGPPILIGLTLITLGLILVTFPGWVGVPQVYGLPLGLVAIAAGLGWLVLRLWPDPDDVPPPLYLDDPDDPDGGAVL